MNYRFDVRDKKTFQKDIKKWHRIENHIAAVFEKRLTDSFGVPFSVEPNGCGMDGEYLEDNEVTTEPDFIIAADGVKKRIPLEIKASDGHLKVFHIKVDQVRSYLDYDANMIMLMVRGTETDQPVFTIMRPSMFVAHSFPVVRFATWGNKKCYRLYATQFHWEPLYSDKRIDPALFTKSWLNDNKKVSLALSS